MLSQFSNLQLKSLPCTQEEVDESMYDLAINAEGTRTLFTTMSVIILSFLLLYGSVLYLWHAFSTFSIRRFLFQGSRRGSETSIISAST